MLQSTRRAGDVCCSFKGKLTDRVYTSQEEEDKEVTPENVKLFLQSRQSTLCSLWENRPKRKQEAQIQQLACFRFNVSPTLLVKTDLFVPNSSTLQLKCQNVKVDIGQFVLKGQSLADIPALNRKVYTLLNLI